MSVRRKPSAWLHSALFGLALLLLLALPLTAKERRLLKFYSDIDVLADSSVDVTENITFQFIGGPWQGIYRTIPVEYAGPRGLNYSLFLDVKRITDEEGKKLRYESSRDRQYLKLKIYVPNADNSTRTISIEYVVSDALRFFDEHDEFYWNVTGDEWPIPIGEAGAHIVLPNGTSGIQANVFTGAYRAVGRNATAEIAGTGVDVRTTAPLAMHEGLTVAVAFDKGTVREPTALSNFLLYLRSNWPLGLPIIAFPLMFWWWWTRGRDPRLRPIAAQYEPPDQLTPGEVGTLIDNSVDMRDITASIVDLAVRGYIVIEEKTKDHLLGLTHSKEYIFHLQKSQADWASLKPHEQDLLSGLFTGGNAGDTVSLADLHNRFYQNIAGIKNEIFGSLVTHGYYARRPDSVRASYIGFGIVVGFILIAGGSWLSKNYGMAPLPFVVAGILTGAIICGFGWFMPARTQSGARALEQLLGFEDFLNHVEADRFNRMIKTPAMFEKFLPFAMALGVEKNWSKAFQNIYTQPPQWYQGGSFGPGFYPYLFVNNLNAMSLQAGSVLSSAPRSSGGSGFSDGGGFSGGGFGGGGGDAF
ncbi:MAG TPA: DUF2207 domain-containing protein [Candidatus Acidoferrum sp.]|nr:DUF2207 domain-containing protein [Candidatus Acidoferrum sp.]